MESRLLKFSLASLTVTCQAARQAIDQLYALSLAPLRKSVELLSPYAGYFMERETYAQGLVDAISDRAIQHFIHGTEEGREFIMKISDIEDANTLEEELVDDMEEFKEAFKSGFVLTYEITGDGDDRVLRVFIDIASEEDE